MAMGDAGYVFKPMVVALGQVSTLLSQPEFDWNKPAQVRETLERYLSFRPALHDRNPLQEYVSNIRARDVNEAGATLAWLVRLTGQAKTFDKGQYGDAPFSAGIANAVLFDSGALDVPTSRTAVASIERLASEGGLFRDKASESAVAAASALERVKQIEGDLAPRAGELEQNLRAKAREFEQTMQADWKRLTETYEEKLSLSAPSKYWAAKAKQHKARAIAFATACGIVGAAGAGGLWRLYVALFGSTPVSTLPTWAQVISTTVTAVLFLWTLKTLVRLTMSHVHLNLDAEERRIMILSYLALARKREVSEEERKALFAAIFRPTGDGIVKEELPPFPMMEFLKSSK